MFSNNNTQNIAQHTYSTSPSYSTDGYLPNFPIWNRDPY